ncbi:MAG: hypothetical protein WD940_01765 [Patescibacteria group bacterium]
MSIEIYLDMDGVTTNFVRGVALVFGRDYDQLIGEWPKGYEFVHVPLGLPSEKYLWNAINPLGERFWIGLEEYQHFRSMYERLTELGDVVFLTKPSNHPTSVSGKLYWLQQRFGLSFRNYIFTKRKELVAQPGTILIDDSPGNCVKFAEKGGEVCLFPQPWNDGASLLLPNESILEYVIRRVKSTLPIGSKP